MKWLLLHLFFISQSFAEIRVVATTFDLAWAIKRLGGKHVAVTSLLQGDEDPHYVDAMPHWIVKVSRADIFCMVGLQLEIGWVPKILARSGNTKVQSNGKGYCDASKQVTPLDVPTQKIDRSMGDIHPGGNPHYHLGPDFYIQAIEEIFTILIKADPSSTEIYNKNLKSLKNEIFKLKKEIKNILRPVQHKKFMSYHKEFSYFFHSFNLTNVGEIEETPGIPPSAGRIARVSLKAKKDNVALVLASKHNPKKIINRFSEISKVPAVLVSTSIQKNKPPSSYRELLLEIAKTIVKKAK